MKDATITKTGRVTQLEVTEDGEILDNAPRDYNGQKLSLFAVNGLDYYRLPMTPPGAPRTPWSHDNDAISRDTGILFEDTSLAIQDDEPSANINTIMQRMGITEVPPPGSIELSAEILELDEMEFQEAMNIVAAGSQAFARLPADVRARYGNDPRKLVAAIDAVYTDQDEPRRQRKLQDLHEMGLSLPGRTPPVVEQPVAATPVATPQAKGPETAG